MNRQETARTLAYLSAAFPTAPELTDATALLWAEECARIDYEIATKAARRIALEDMRFPPLARFLEMVRACRPSLIAIPESTDDLPTNEEQLANVARLRKLMREKPIVRHIDELRRTRPGEPA